jgi:hypothetical protein
LSGSSSNITIRPAARIDCPVIAAQEQRHPRREQQLQDKEQAAGAGPFSCFLCYLQRICRRVRRYLIQRRAPKACEHIGNNEPRSTSAGSTQYFRSLIGSYRVVAGQQPIARQGRSGCCPPGGTEMIERPTVEPIDMLQKARGSNQGNPQKPRLSMAWVLDPTSGKPTARWIVESTEMTWSKFFASAA